MHAPHDLAAAAVAPPCRLVISISNRYHFVERSYGKSTRSVRLPETADTANATAGYYAGVLTVTLPKKEAPAARRLQIPVVGGDGKAPTEGGDTPAAESMDAEN